MRTDNIDYLTPIQKTLLITLKGRALDHAAPQSILEDPVAPTLADRLGCALDTVKLGAGVPEGIAIRSRTLDRAVGDFVAAHPDAVVVELGAGLETRMFRVAHPDTVDWYAIDLPEVIAVRDKLVPARDNAHSVGESLLSSDWANAIPAHRPTILVADGLIGFLTERDVEKLLRGITGHFHAGELVTNVYTALTARLTRYYTKSVGVPKGFRGYGFNDPQHLCRLNPRLRFCDEQTIATVPEAKFLSGPTRFNARMLRYWPALARCSMWVVRYQFGCGAGGEDGE